MRSEEGTIEMGEIEAAVLIAMDASVEIGAMTHALTRLLRDIRGKEEMSLVLSAKREEMIGRYTRLGPPLASRLLQCRLALLCRSPRSMKPNRSRDSFIINSPTSTLTASLV